MCFFAYKVAGYYYGGGYPVNNYGYNYNQNSVLDSSPPGNIQFSGWIFKIIYKTCFAN